MIVRWEKRTQGTVDEAAGEDFIIRSLAFALGETTRETACRSIFLLVFHGEWHEVGTGSYGTGCTYGGQKHRATHAKFNGAIGLLRNLTCFKGDGTAIAQGNGFFNWINQIVYHNCFIFLNLLEIFGRKVNIFLLIDQI